MPGVSIKRSFTRGQNTLTAAGADYVCREGKICDRAVTRCTRKIEQVLRFSYIKGTGFCFALKAKSGGGSIGNLVQIEIRSGRPSYSGSKTANRYRHP